MTCQEIRLYFENPLRPDDELRPELEHLEHCPDCAHFVETQRQLSDNLRLARDASPAFPTSLDTAILANYRKQVAQKSIPVIAAPRKRSFAILRWSAVAAAFGLVAVLFYFLGQKKSQTVAQPQLSRPVVQAESHPVDSAVQPSETKPASASRPKVRRQLPNAVAATTDPLPPGFRSLMYCDELSCGDLMELIRIQLPPASYPFASSGGGQPISADVLVGPDGIARGIRVVQ